LSENAPEGVWLGKMKKTIEKPGKFLTERLTDVSRETYLVCGFYAPRLNAKLFHVKHELAGETNAN